MNLKKIMLTGLVCFIIGFASQTNLKKPVSDLSNIIDTDRIETIIGYHDGGQKKEEYTINSEGKSHGLSQEWDGDGNLVYDWVEE